MEDVLVTFEGNNRVACVGLDPFSRDPRYRFHPETDCHHDIKLLKSQLGSLRERDAHCASTQMPPESASFSLLNVLDPAHWGRWETIVEETARVTVAVRPWLRSLHGAPDMFFLG